MDFLSNSPSLHEILEFVDYTDINSCRMVNKRVAQVIKNNYTSLPRTEISVNLEKPLLSPILRIYEGNQLFLVYLHKGITSIEKKYQENNGNVFLVEFVKELHMPFQKRVTWRTKSIMYRSQGIEDELRKIFSFIFRRYHISTITLDAFNVIPEKWLNIISDAHFRSRSRCSTISVRRPNPGLKHLCETLGSTVVLGTAYGAWRQDDLLTTLSWQVPVRIHRCSRTYLIGLFKRWETGEVTLTKVELINLGTEAEGKVEWLKVSRKLSTLKHATLLPTKDNLANASMRIQRAIDNQIVSVDTSREEHSNSIVIKEQ